MRLGGIVRPSTSSMAWIVGFLVAGARNGVNRRGGGGGLFVRSFQIATTTTTSTITRNSNDKFPKAAVTASSRFGGVASTRARTAPGPSSRLFGTENGGSSVSWTTDRVRQAFIDYFADGRSVEEGGRGHAFQPSSPVAPLNDPTLLFTNAGMNQFKPIFLGQVDPASPLAGLRRAVNSQKCIRAGGKHNDLDDVGYDTYHHTFFEMLGTWSFGDYFKKEAIEYAWDLLTNVYKLDPDRLYASYFAGDDVTPPDNEARDYWLQFLPPERVLAFDAKDNFWEMGEVGPCGPCSEIHYDRIGNRDASSLVNADDPMVIEIWNIVFIQYNRLPDTSLQTLPAQHIDTGMGLERLVSLLQGKTSNYDIDIFQPIFEEINKLTELGPYTGKIGAEEDADLKDTSYRILADHIRTLVFAITDGAIPNNEGRGYVLRRILRRATRYGQQILKMEPGFLSKLVPVVVSTFGEFFPELKAKEADVIAIIQEEEDAFSTMLQRGIKYFDELKEELKDEKISEVPGAKAFYLYDTLGFPYDLTELMAEEAGLSVDSKGFEAAMKEQKDRSRQAQRAARLGGDASALPALELEAKQTAYLADDAQILPTDDAFKYEWDAELPATVLAIYSKDGFIDKVEPGDNQYVGLIMDKTSYYAEAGGQEADRGVIEIMDSEGKKKIGEFVVNDVQVYAGYVVHKGFFETDDDASASLSLGNVGNCKVDYERRRLIAPNHSMTHVLNAALNQVLGDANTAIEQRGSLCNDEKLRFDFSYKKALNVKQLKAVEEFCQNAIAKEEPVTNKVMPLDEAKAIDGVRAVFGEVYPDPVRVVSVGTDTSIEFCGGTHLSNTAEAEAFCLVEETAVAKGIRRITAVTKTAAIEALQQGENFIKVVSDLESLDAEAISDLDKQAGAVRKDLDAAFLSAPLKAELRAKIEGVQKKASDAKKKAVQQRVDSVLNDVKKDIEAAVASNQKSLVLNVDIGADSKASQSVMNTVKSLAPDMAFLGLSEEEAGSGGKLLVFAVVPDSLIESCDLKANEWVQATLAACGGRGGGKPGNAQGQAPECTDVQAVIDAATAFAESKVLQETS